MLEIDLQRRATSDKSSELQSCNRCPDRRNLFRLLAAIHCGDTLVQEPDSASSSACIPPEACGAARSKSAHVTRTAMPIRSAPPDQELAKDAVPWKYRRSA